MMRTTTFAWIAGAALAASFLWAGTVIATEIPRPNIVLVLVDDMGYGDPGAYGGREIPTPHVDQLAAEGIRFTDGYVTCPVCGPSRVGLLSGAYQQRFGVQWNQDVTFGGFQLPSSQSLIHETLSSAGYATGLVGKSNLPNYPHTTFDESMSVIHFGADYFPDEVGHYPGVDESKPTYGYSSHKAQWGPIRDGEEYLTDRLGRQAVDFIKRHRDNPFFLYLAFNAPHSPFMAKAENKRQVSHIENEFQQLYAAMCLSVDENIGRVMNELEKQNLRENTLVVFASDNGPALAPGSSSKTTLGSTGGLNGRKGSTLEGGIRVPFIMSWPSELDRGEVYSHTVSTLDVYATLCAAAGVEVPDGTKLDGINLLPYIRDGKPGAPHEALYWFHDDQKAMRKGKWKLRVSDNQRTLFNLEADVGEQIDLSLKHPKLLDHLLKELETFCQTMPPQLRNRKQGKQ